MIIQLCEDDGFLHDGKPELVVLMIKTDDGKTHRIPYPASRTIEELYIDARKLSTDKLNSKPEPFTDAIKSLASSDQDGIPETSDDKPLYLAPNPNANTIEREDRVVCVKIKKDMDGNDIERDVPIVVGNEYRVINIIRAKDGGILVYEVLDDESQNKIRIPCFPEEIFLARKFVPGPPRKMVFEEVVTCTRCNEQTAIRLNEQGTKYEGACAICGQALSCERPTKPINN